MIDNNMKELAKYIMECYEKAYEIHKLDVNHIIDNKITDINYIERTLDNCLVIYTEKGFYLFLKLLFYYSDIDPEKSYAYFDILKEERKEEYDDYIKKLEKKK